MDSEPELAQLALLLEISANTARKIAHYKKADAAEIHWAAHQIEEIADSLRAIGLEGRPAPASSLKVLSPVYGEAVTRRDAALRVTCDAAQ